MSKLKYAGFSVGGTHWLYMDMEGASDEAERSLRMRKIGYEEARLTHLLGGNLLRLFFSPKSLLDPLGIPLLGEPHGNPWYLLDEVTRAAFANNYHASLCELLDKLDDTPVDGEGLDLKDIDDYLAGVLDYNEGNQGTESVSVLITQTLDTPRTILEMPAEHIMAWHGYSLTFREVWETYCRIITGAWSRVAHRYTSAGKSVVCAFELSNEPDYEWLPDEVRIEHSGNKSASPLGKYVTELHNTQIPVSQETAPPFTSTPWGGFTDQSGPWPPAEPTPVLDFDWGRKFDWYVQCYADLSARMAGTIKNVLEKNMRTDVTIVSAGVTHNNLDYLIRMYRANPKVFVDCDAIGLHPYHWPGHDIWDSEFKSPYDLSDWQSASPREFAFRYFKRFDFFKEVARLTRETGPESFGLEGKRIWLTETGIPTKMLGQYNTEHAQHMPFIRQRRVPADTLPYKSVVWEDLWEDFFDQVSLEDLAEANCDAIAFYTLRETAQPALDKHDDDRSNFSLIRRDGSPRMEHSTFMRFREFMTGERNENDEVVGSEMPIWARGKSFSTKLLKSRPWQQVTLPDAVVRATTMLSLWELHLLYWVTSEYFENKGEVVELGPFVGGSTQAMAAGLRSTWTGSSRKIHSYDRFETDDFMNTFYFQPKELEIRGSNFRNVFDNATREYSDLLEVTEGDILKETWSGEPIEILFVDIAKIWEVNDHVVKAFFPCLIPNKSLVLQQGEHHQWGFWCAITMELLSDHFEYVGGVRENMAIYRCIKKIEPSDITDNLRSLGLERLSELLRSAISKREEHFDKGMLTTALIGLHGDFGDTQVAREIAEACLVEYHDEPCVITLVKAFSFMQEN